MSVRNSLSWFVGLSSVLSQKEWRRRSTTPKKQTPVIVLTTIERFSYDLEMKTRKQNRNNKRTEIERFDWFIERIQTRVAFGWLSERSGEKSSSPRTF